MNNNSQEQIRGLILEVLEELAQELQEAKKTKKTKKRIKDDPRRNPTKIKDRNGNVRDLLLDKPKHEHNHDKDVEILELGAILEETGEPVCEGCLVAYMNENKDLLEEAEYRGRKVTLGKPMPNDPGGKKKSKVYVRDPKTGNVKKVTFGDRSMRIKKSNPKRRKSFRARHNCKNPGPRTKAKFWSCRAWE